MILAVIPARGGSKRLPRKNVVPFGGRPLVTWSIALAQHVPLVTRCVVSTDDAEIAEVADRAGAEVIIRPETLARDETPSLDVLRHAFEQVSRDGQRFDGVMLLQPTNPLRPVGMVEAAIQRFLTEPCDSLITISRRRLKLGQVTQGQFVPSYTFGTQSRLMPDACYENGLLYLTKPDVLRCGSLTGDTVLGFEAERPFDDVDIDEPIDLLIGEAILHAVRGQLAYA